MQEANKEALTTASPEIHVHIMSGGGDAYAGMSAYYHIRRNPLPVVTYVDSMAASAATLLLLAGHRRVACKHAFCLIHQISTGFFGKYHDMIDEMHNTHNLMDAFRQLYMERSNMTRERLEELFRSEKALDAATCLQEGILDEVLDV